MNEMRRHGSAWKPRLSAVSARGLLRRHSHNGSANAREKYQRYLALAREAGSAGNSVEMENYYQHAEHYFRVMRTAGE